MSEWHHIRLAFQVDAEGHVVNVLEREDDVADGDFSASSGFYKTIIERDGFLVQRYNSKDPGNHTYHFYRRKEE